MPNEYEVHRSGAPPSAGQIRDSGGMGVLWLRPDGSVFKAMGPNDFQQATPEETEYARQPPAPSAEEQEAAIGGVGGAELSGGQQAEDIGQLDSMSPDYSGVQGIGGGPEVRGEDLQRARDRAELAKAKGVSDLQSRSASEGDLGGLSIGERATAAQMIAEGLVADEAEAGELIRQERERLSAQEQAGALQDAGTRGVVRK